MKIKTLLFLFLAAGSSLLPVWADETPDVSTAWVESFLPVDSKNQSTVDNVINSADGNFFTVAHYLTTTGTESGVKFFGYDLALTKTTANSGNYNLAIVKHKKDGTPLWMVNSTNGYADVGSSAVAATADGGLVMFLRARHRTGAVEEGDSILISLKDAAGNESSLKYNYNEENETTEYHQAYQAAIIKIDGSGNVTNLKRVYASTKVPAEIESTIKAGLAFMSSPLSFDCAAVDADGNYYAAGIMSGDLTFENSENGTTVIKHHNLDGWDGDTQKTRGNSFLLKFNSDLKLVDYTTTSAADGGSDYDTYNTYDRISAMECIDGKLYTAGLVSSKGNSMAFAGKTLSTGVSGLTSVWVSSVDAETLEADNIELCNAEESANGNVIQLKNMTVSTDGSYLYVCGSLRGVINAGSVKLSSAKAQLNNFFVRINVNDGSVKDGLRTEIEGISNLFSVVDNSDSIFVYGYDMGRKPAQGHSNIVFESYTRDTFEKKTEYNLFTGTTAATTAWPCSAVSGNTIMLAVRAKSVLTPFGGDAFGNATAFYGAVVAFDFKNIDFTKKPVPTVAEDVEDGDAYKVFASNGVITVAGAEGEQIAVYSLAGVREAYVASAASQVNIPVAGNRLYIVRVNDKSQKVLMSR